ncbi:hypothetical protein GBF38_001948, partial [Nibea albiflora]
QSLPQSSVPPIDFLYPSTTSPHTLPFITVVFLRGLLVDGISHSPSHKEPGGVGARASVQMARCHRDLVSTCSPGTLSGHRRRELRRAHHATPSPWQLMSPVPA